MKSNFADFPGENNTEIFKLEIEIGNAAMKDKHDIIGALRDLADRLSRMTTTTIMCGCVNDRNGNLVGQFYLNTED